MNLKFLTLSEQQIKPSFIPFSFLFMLPILNNISSFNKNIISTITNPLISVCTSNRVQIMTNNSVKVDEPELSPKSPEKMWSKDEDCEEKSSLEYAQLATEYRASIRENVERIQMMRLLHERSSALVAAKAQLADLQENQGMLSTSHNALLSQVDELSTELKEKNKKVVSLESQLADMSVLRITVKEVSKLHTGYAKCWADCLLTHELNCLQEIQEDEKNLSWAYNEMKVAHAETALELEKTRDMLLVQHQINKRYQDELEIVKAKADNSEREHKEEWEKLNRLLDLKNNRIQQLEGNNGEDFGTLDYWMRLKSPIAHCLQAYNKRLKAQAYLSANVLGARKAQPEESRSEIFKHRNQLWVEIVRCCNLRSRHLGAQPSPYAIYQFFTFSDHDTPIIPASNHPHFGDRASFPVHMTLELDGYLRQTVLPVYVFDDNESELGWFLGKVQVPLLPLAQDKAIQGNFNLNDPMGKPNGSIELKLEWESHYLSPESSLKPATQSVENDNKAPLSVENYSEVPLSVDKHNEANLQVEDYNEAPPSVENKETDLHIEHYNETPLSVENYNEAPLSVANYEAPLSCVYWTFCWEEWVIWHRDITSVFSTAANRPSEQADEASETPTTDSDDVIVTPLSQKGPKRNSDKICIEIVSLAFDPEAEVMSDDSIQQVYVEYKFHDLPLSETETPVSLRKPRAGEDIHFHFNKVIHLNPVEHRDRRKFLFSMLQEKNPEQRQLKFIVVSDPEEQKNECQEVGYAYLELWQILDTGRDILEQEIDIINPQDKATSIGKLKVSLQATDALQAIFKEMSEDIHL
uniref:C2 domain-containing protein n=1 Tax=Vombatus ursinus TaxID=29139 RepID=A0A4X2LZ89_VOMUR